MTIEFGLNLIKTYYVLLPLLCGVLMYLGFSKKRIFVKTLSVSLVVGAKLSISLMCVWDVLSVDDLKEVAGYMVICTFLAAVSSAFGGVFGHED